MKINNNLVVQKHPIGDTFCLIIDDFFSDISEIVNEETVKLNFEGEPLMPFPLGAKTRLNVDNPDIFTIIEDHYETKPLTANADLTFTTFNDMSLYNDFSKIEEEIDDEMINLELGSVKRRNWIKSFLNIHPGRPIFDAKNRYHGICFLQDYSKLPDDFQTKITPTLQFYRLKELSKNDDANMFSYDDTVTDHRLKSMTYNRELYEHAIGTFPAQDTYPTTLPVIQDVWNRQHSSVCFTKHEEIPDKFNRMVFFPGNYFHMLKVHQELLYPTLTLRIVFEHGV